MFRKIIARTLVAAALAAPFALAAASPASATCQPPNVVVTHGATWGEAHVIAGCNIRVWVQTRFGPYYGPFRSGNSYSDVINLPAAPTSGGWQQSGGSLHRTF